MTLDIRVDLKAFEEQVQEIAEASAPKGAAIFYGSSSIRIWGQERLARHMAPAPALCHGIGGSCSEHMLYRYGALIKPYEPKMLVWYCGSNDLALGYTPEAAFALAERVFAWTHVDFPECKILLLSVFHCRSRDALWPEYQVFNRYQERYAAERPWVRALDLESLYHTEDGRIRDEIFQADQLHLNDEGYERLQALVRPHVLELMGLNEA